jgi:hypothetical protein
MTLRNSKAVYRQRRKSAGQALMEYLVVISLGVIVLVSGDNPPIQQLANAIKGYYTDYSFAISISNMPNCYYSKSALGHTATADVCVDLKDPKWPEITID